MRILIRVIVIAAAVAAIWLLPAAIGRYYTQMLSLAGIYAIAGHGLNLLAGYTGQTSLGHAGFYAIGAYTTAILMHNYDIAYYWTLPAAGAVCFVIGFLFGLPALRLQNLYLALATFTLAVAMPQILKFHGLEAWTGGVQGLDVNQPDPPSFLPIDGDQWLYYFTLIVVIVMFAAASNLIRSRSGRAIKAIRDNPIAAAAMGINTSLYKTLTFGVSALYTGVAGALGALAVAFVAPDSFTIFLSISLLVGLVVGGVGSIPGCLFGGLFVLFGPNIAEYVATRLFHAIDVISGGLIVFRVSQSNALGLTGVVYGVILLIVIFVMPAGAAGFVRFAVSWLARLRQTRPGGTEGGKL